MGSLFNMIIWAMAPDTHEVSMAKKLWGWGPGGGQHKPLS